MEAGEMELNRIPRRAWLAGTSASLVTLAASSRSAGLVGNPDSSPLPYQAAANPEDADRIRRMKWWHEARFGMFIHWGLYSVLGRHEWVMENEGIPVAEYAPLAKQFKPKPFPARDWAKIACETGMRYMVMTTKHHEGFCHFDTKTTDYCSPKQGPGR